MFFNPFDCHKNITRSSAHSYFLQFIGITVKQIQTNLAQTSISTCRSYSVKQLIITWAISLRGQLLLLGSNCLLITGVLSCHKVLLRVSWEGFLNLISDFWWLKKIISWRISFSCMVKPYSWFLKALNVLLNFQTCKDLTCFR